MTLQISLDGSSEETNALTRGRGNFENGVEFARSVSDSPAEKRLKMVVSRGNLADVEKFYRLALSLGFTPEFAFIFRSGNGECEWDEKTLTPLEKLKVMKTVQRLNEESGANAQLPLCSLGCPLSLDDSELSLCVKTDGSFSHVGAVRRKIHRGKRAFLRRDGIRGGNAPGARHRQSPRRKRLFLRALHPAREVRQGLHGERGQLTGDPLAVDGGCEFRKMEIVTLSFGKLIREEL